MPIQSLDSVRVLEFFMKLTTGLACQNVASTVAETLTTDLEIGGSNPVSV
jgi:hypothetical protein